MIFTKIAMVFTRVSLKYSVALQCWMGFGKLYPFVMKH